MIDSGATHNAAVAAHREALEHRHSKAFAAISDWLAALATQQHADMIQCPPDKLPAAQIRLRQLLALHDALTRTEMAGTGHVCD